MRPVAGSIMAKPSDELALSYDLGDVSDHHDSLSLDRTPLPPFPRVSPFMMDRRAIHDIPPALGASFAQGSSRTLAIPTRAVVAGLHGLDDVLVKMLDTLWDVDEEALADNVEDAISSAGGFLKKVGAEA
jgi:hypothetical protein